MNAANANMLRTFYFSFNHLIIFNIWLSKLNKFKKILNLDLIFLKEIQMDWTRRASAADHKLN